MISRQKFHSDSFRNDRPLLSFPLVAVISAALYFALAAAGLYFGWRPGNASTLWYANALAMVALFYIRRNRWWAMLAIIAALIMLLAKYVPHWGSALIVGAVVGGIGWLLIGKAMAALQQTDLTPRETVETLKEDATWMKQQMK